MAVKLNSFIQIFSLRQLKDRILCSKNQWSQTLNNIIFPSELKMRNKLTEEPAWRRDRQTYQQTKLTMNESTLRFAPQSDQKKFWFRLVIVLNG